MNPWTSFGTNSMDSQPWALISGFVFLLYGRYVHIPPYMGPLTVSITMGIFLTLFLSADPLPSDIFRSISSYAVLLIVYVAFYTYLFHFGFPSGLIFFSCISWLAFTLIEAFAPSVRIMIAAYRTSAERGFTSLAPEPTFFAIFLFFISWIILVGHNYRPAKRDKLLLLANLIGIVALARSSMVIGYIAVTAAIYTCCVAIKALGSFRLTKRAIPLIFLLTFGVPLIFFLIDTFMAETRAGDLLSKVFENGFIRVIMSDESISTRVEDAVLSLHGATVNVLVPGGIDTYAEQKQVLRMSWGDFFIYPYEGNKIMSWNGTLIYELGIFGVLAYCFLIAAAVRKSGAKLVEIITFITVSTGAIPMAFPLMPMLFATWAYKGSTVRTSFVELPR